MPKIKFSTLVSGMSGTSNGSVFAKNRYGSYFRTKGSRLKSSAGNLSDRKSIFAHVSQSFKKLNNVQYQSWVDNAHLFPVVDVFGDERNPTPFELYCRLNNVRLEFGEDLLLVCPGPRAMPAITEFESIIPDLKQFIPRKGIAIGNPRSGLGGNKITSSNLIPAQAFTKNMMYFLALDFSAVTQKANFAVNDIVLMKIAGALDSELVVTLLASADGKHKLKIEYTDGANAGELETIDPCLTLGARSIIGIGFDDGVNPSAKVYVNGIERPCTFSGDPTTINQDAIGTIVLFDNANTINLNAVFSQFSFVNSAPTDDDMKHGSLGYVLGTELFAFDGNLLSETKRINASMGSPEQYLGLASTPSPAELMINYAPLSIPCIEFAWVCTGETEVLLDIYSTDSKGVNSMRDKPRKRSKKIAKAQDETIYLPDWYCELHPEECPGWIFSTNDYNVGFSARLVDIDTGVATAVYIKDKKKPRFKAGAEMNTSTS